MEYIMNFKRLLKLAGITTTVLSESAPLSNTISGRPSFRVSYDTNSRQYYAVDDRTYNPAPDGSYKDHVTGSGPSEIEAVEDLADSLATFNMYDEDEIWFEVDEFRKQHQPK
jgi:hypothetical protein